MKTTHSGACLSFPVSLRVIDVLKIYLFSVSNKNYDSGWHCLALLLIGCCLPTASLPVGEPGGRLVPVTGAEWSTRLVICFFVDTIRNARVAFS